MIKSITVIVAPLQGMIPTLVVSSALNYRRWVRSYCSRVDRYGIYLYALAHDPKPFWKLVLGLSDPHEMNAALGRSVEVHDGEVHWPYRGHRVQSVSEDR